jgi:Cu(I)/Ag(I) efflux system protein CusF
MKQSAALSLVIAFLAAAPILSHAQSSGMKGMDMEGKDSMSKGSTHKANGVVKALDAQKSSVTIAHAPVPSMRWPAMTMTFAVKDKAMLDKLPAGKKVEVEFVQQGKDYVITDVK